MDQLIDALDLTILEDCYRGSGSAAHRPDLMFKIVVLQTLDGRRSPAQWSVAVKENIAVQWICRGIKPSRSALYDFRNRLAEPIADLCAQAVRQAQLEGLLHPTEGVLDGTFVRACASRHRMVNMSTLQRRHAELDAVLTKDAADQPVENMPKWMAKTPAGREELAERYTKAHEELERRLAVNARRPKGKRLDEKKVVVSTSDPEAPTGRDKEKVFCPLYTVQYMVEPQSLIILSYEAFAQATDANTLGLMLDRTQEVIGHHLDLVNADAGYVSVLDLQECARRGVELIAPVHENSYSEKKRTPQPNEKLKRELFTWDDEQQIYICPQGHAMNYEAKERKARSGDREVIQYRYRCSGDHCRQCPLAQRCTSNPEKGRTINRLEGQELLDAQRLKMQTPEAQAKQRQRGQVVERGFADAKAHRNFRRLHGRGLKRARAESGIVVFAQNALTINRLRQTRASPGDCNT